MGGRMFDLHLKPLFLLHFVCALHEHAAHTCCKLLKKDKNTNCFQRITKVWKIPEGESPLYAGVTPGSISKWQGFGVSSAERWLPATAAVKEARLQNSVLTNKGLPIPVEPLYTGPSGKAGETRLVYPERSRSVQWCERFSPSVLTGGVACSIMSWALLTSVSHFKIVGINQCVFLIVNKPDFKSIGSNSI